MLVHVNANGDANLQNIFYTAIHEPKNHLLPSPRYLSDR